MSINVTLDTLEHAQFPDRCILCNCRGPGNSLEVTLRTGRIWQVLLQPMHRRRVRIPACAFCSQLLARQLKMRYIAVIVAGLSAIVLYSSLAYIYEGSYLTQVRIGGILLLLMPYVVWEGLFPMPFHLEGSSRTITYTFEDHAYAREFALLNLQPGDPFFARLMEHEEVY